jgi:outer membrane biosynthesis protein TonB
MTVCPELVVGILLGGLGCARAPAAGPATPARRANSTTRAGDCHFTMPDGTLLMGESEVDDPPRMIDPGPQVFPAQARQHGIPGRVRVTYVIGRDGFAIRPSFRVVDATNHLSSRRRRR